MTDITELAQSLKAAAEKATKGQWEYEAGAIWNTDESGWVQHMVAVEAGDEVSDEEHKANMQFITAATPVNILMILDALSESQSRAENESDCANRTINLAIDWQIRCKDAEKRVAELTEFLSHIKKCLVKNREYAPLSHEEIDTLLGIRADGKGADQ
ncbi:ead/Ea22-like family protein [Klebsiella aerogenes]|uniref:ead/Ea22-like family protein n=1 Tax=Klebsiella aerogenes TaxID=548 RepID=UPI00069B7D06|nr:ead/Ea22-like family protein [Klebsiella aerogenes]